MASEYVTYNDLIKESNKIIITGRSGFNPKKKNSKPKLAVITKDVDIQKVANALKCYKEKGVTDWMTMPDLYIYFMFDKAIVKKFGLVISNYIRTDNRGDMKLYDETLLHNLLKQYGIKHFSIRNIVIET